ISSFGIRARRATRLLHPIHVKLERQYIALPYKGQTHIPQTRIPANSGHSCIWYRGGDSNPYSLWPLPPQGSVSTNSTTSAKLLCYSWPGATGTSASLAAGLLTSGSGTSSTTAGFCTSSTAGLGRPDRKSVV